MDRLTDISRLPGTVIQDVAAREKVLRRAQGLSQEQLAKKTGVSLGSLRRFEQTGQIALESLVAISFALGCEAELDTLFSKPGYSSIQEVIDRARAAR